MSTVRAVVHPGWLAVTGPEVDAVVAAGDRHAELLETAAAQGLVALLEAVTAHGLSAAPDLVACARTPTGLRVVVRGAGVVVLPDGTRLGAQGRMPWLDVDLDLAEGDDGVVVLEAPEPEQPRGWRRPARLARAAGDERPSSGLVVDRGTPEVEPAPEPDVTEVEAEVVEVEPDERVEPDESVEVEQVEAAAAAPQPDLTLPPPDDVVGLAPVARVPPAPAPRSGLIEAVPWRRADRVPAPTTRGADAPPPVPTPTEVLPVTQAPVTLEEPEPTRAVAPASERSALDHPAPDHPVPEQPVPEQPVPQQPTPDVTTNRGALPTAEEDLDRPMVLAVLCPAGHPSPPHAGTCRTCDREIPPQQPFPTPRPSLGVLTISTGGSVPLDRGVLLGRAPRVNEELPANQRPHLLRVGGADRDISRNHAEVVLEGWHVLVRDLGSTNGTTVTLPGQEPVRLRPTEDQGIEPGTLVTLADEVVLTYEVDG